MQPWLVPVVVVCVCVLVISWVVIIVVVVGVVIMRRQSSKYIRSFLFINICKCYYNNHL